MRWRTLVLAVFCAAWTSCGVEAKQGASRTLLGISQQQALVSAQHVLAEKGFETEEVDLGRGVVKSAWRDRAYNSVQYEVTVAPKSEGDGGLVLVTVSANEKDRSIRGWGEQYASSKGTEQMLGAIIDAAVDSVGEAPVELSEVSSAPGCSGSSDCPAGQHCGSGRCVSECTGAADCPEGEQCDDRGRCVPVPKECEPCDVAGKEPESGKKKKKWR